MNASVLQPKTWITLCVCFALFLGAVIGFGALADEVLEGDTITEIGGVIGISLLTLIALGILLKKHLYKQAVIVAATLCSAV